MQLEELLKKIDESKSFIFKPNYKMLDEEIVKNLEKLGFSIIYVERIDYYLARYNKKTEEYDSKEIENFIRKYQHLCYFEPLNNFKVMY
ncbi:MAG: hypothetical protein QXS41_00145 [Candidatus Woesearchaeota archaeon]